MKRLTHIDKVEKILVDSLDSIPSPSPSVKIQTMGGKGIKANLESGVQIQFSLGFKTYPNGYFKFEIVHFKLEKDHFLDFILD